ncbi:hypothetical protein Taro_007597 [Colocasia esculenta]|uniref:Uncharacterized protein n=1 Tax=Colocasia esculenta TaxID=4460 RepID=A0A843U4E1_COLES|nr:hypothetical protein [Colocasia esculenta]
MPVLFFSPPLPSSPLALSAKTQIPQRRLLASLPRKTLSAFVVRASDNEAGAVSPVAVEEVPKKEEAPVPVAVEEKPVKEEKKPGALQSNGAALKVEAPRFKDPRWVAGTWDLEQFKKNGTADWDAVIDAETRRRKWLEENPEASSNTDPVIFDTSIVPWWAWMKRFHLPEAELLNG